MKTLISTTDFVLEQEKNYAHVTRCVKKDPFLLVVDYAIFLKQPLKLGMFVPCDENGNILGVPNYYGCFLDGSYVNHPQLINYENCVRFKKAQEKVLFKPPYNHYWKLDQIEGKTIEDLLIDRIDYELTESAIKQIF